MRFTLHAHLHTLHCITPEDETVTSRSCSRPSLGPTVPPCGRTRRAGPASPRWWPWPRLARTEISKEDVVESGANFHVHEWISSFDPNCAHPVHLHLRRQADTGVLPGRLVAISALLDEDGPGVVIDRIHPPVTAHVQVKINAFFGALTSRPSSPAHSRPRTRRFR